MGALNELPNNQDGWRCSWEPSLGFPSFPYPD